MLRIIAIVFLCTTPFWLALLGINVIKNEIYQEKNKSSRSENNILLDSIINPIDSIVNPDFFIKEKEKEEISVDSVLDIKKSIRTLNDNNIKDIINDKDKNGLAKETKYLYQGEFGEKIQISYTKIVFPNIVRNKKEIRLINEQKLNIDELAALIGYSTQKMLLPKIENKRKILVEVKKGKDSNYVVTLKIVISSKNFFDYEYKLYKRKESILVQHLKLANAILKEAKVIEDDKEINNQLEIIQAIKSDLNTEKKYYESLHKDYFYYSDIRQALLVNHLKEELINIDFTERSINTEGHKDLNFTVILKCKVLDDDPYQPRSAKNLSISITESIERYLKRSNTKYENLQHEIVVEVIIENTNLEDSLAL